MIIKSSILRKLPGPILYWQAPNGQLVRLPALLDLLWFDPESGKPVFECSATISLVKNEPRIIKVEMSADDGLVPVTLQNTFRWQTPLDIITQTVPLLLERGKDPFNFNFASEGYPAAALLNTPIKQTLDHDFLKDVVREYRETGRGYAKIMANRRGVSERTVINWIQKAKKEGLL